MATARIIHFGDDNCHRVQVLLRVGYEVCVSESLDRLRLDLESSKGGVGATVVRL
jgi:hypothetical protein